jgi:hypothetical protein
MPYPGKLELKTSYCCSHSVTVGARNQTSFGNDEFQFEGRPYSSPHLIHLADFQLGSSSFNGSINCQHNPDKLSRGSLHMRLAATCIHYADDVGSQALLNHLSLIRPKAVMFFGYFSRGKRTSA